MSEWLVIREVDDPDAIREAIDRRRVSITLPESADAIAARLDSAGLTYERYGATLAVDGREVVVFHLTDV